MAFNLNDFFGLINNNALISSVNDILISVIIILIGIIIGKFSGRIIKKGLSHIKLDELARISGINVSFEDIISNFVAYFIYFISFILGISQLGITVKIINYILIMLIIVIGISLLFVFKFFLTNFSSFYVIMKNKMFFVEDKIKFDNIDGVVKKIGITQTMIETKIGDLLYIPNNILVTKVIQKKKKNKS